MMPKKSDLEKRLAELESLKTKGVINDNEYQTRRAAIIADASQPATKKKRFPVFRVGCLGIIVLVVIVIIAAAVSGTSKESKSDQVSQGGTPSGVGTNKGDVHVPLIANSSGTIFPEGNEEKKSKVTILQIADNAQSQLRLNEFQNPAEGKQWVSFQVLVENVGSEEVSGLDWHLRDSNDFEYDQTFLFGTGEELTSYTVLLPGAKNQGWVYFQIAQAASVKWLRADPNPFAKNDLYFDAQ